MERKGEGTLASPIRTNVREVAAWPRPRLTARVNPTLHDAMLRIEHAGDGGPSIVGLTLAVNLESPIRTNVREVAAWPRPRLTARVNPTLHDAAHRTRG